MAGFTASIDRPRGAFPSWQNTGKLAPLCLVAWGSEAECLRGEVAGASVSSGEAGSGSPRPSAGLRAGFSSL